MKLGIIGANGRMGKLLCELALSNCDIELSAVLDKQEVSGMPSTTHKASSVADFLAHCEVAIDFTAPSASEELLKAALNCPRALVIGTTGLEDHHKNLLKEAAHKMPVLWAANMSLGVAILNRLVQIVSESLRDFDIEIVETHHNKKKDAPSGTALRLAESAAMARKLDLQKVQISGRSGQVGARTKDEIGVLAVRGGDVAGIHNVGFYGDGEFLELKHTATSRATFAKGAITAALWLNKQEAGLYSIEDALGL